MGLWGVESQGGNVKESYCSNFLAYNFIPRRGELLYICHVQGYLLDQIF